MYHVRQLTKWTLNRIAWILVSPAIMLCFVEKLRGTNSNWMFATFGHLMALLPGFPGMCLRRAFYCGTLDNCSWDCSIGFGAIFSQRRTIVDDHAYVGSYALLGNVHLQQGGMIGSRASVLSTGQQHEMDEQGRWMLAVTEDLKITIIGEYSWLGEATVIMAGIGAGAMVAAGSVVASPVPAHVMVAGNPSRFVRRLWEPDKSAAPELRPHQSEETLSGAPQ